MPPTPSPSRAPSSHGRHLWRRFVRASCAAAIVACAGHAAAEEAPAAPEAPTDAGPDSELYRELSAPSGYARFLGSLELGKGIRFNNPYRLATQLGSTPESASLTATYLDLGVGALFGAPDGLQHGAAVHLSLALAGVPQQVLTPSYLIGFGPKHRYLAYGRLGPSIVLTPDPTLGGELALGFAWFLTSRIAVGGELVGDVYYGAGTPDKGVTTYPILSGQLGLLVDYEILP